MKMPIWPVPLGSKPIDLGLERVFEALEKLGNPHHNIPPVVHIAGTNGKGSTLAFIRSVLNEAGFKCHLYTSPHLVEFNERIMLADEVISDEFLSEIVEETKKKCERTKLTFFEGTTLVAILAFSKVEADFTLLETGMGGRLDATNIMGMNGAPNPLLNIITKISKDHSEFLGEKVEEIAFEKASIMKENVDCVLASQAHPEVKNVCADTAKEISSNLKVFGEDFELLKDESKHRFTSKSDNFEIEMPLLGLEGEHQYENAATAIYSILRIKEKLSLEITEDHIIAGLRKAQWKARMQRVDSLCGLSKDVYLDGGHNQDAAEAINKLLKNKEEVYTKTIIVLGLLKRKNADEYIEALLVNDIADEVICIPIEEEDCFSTKELAEKLKPYGVKVSEYGNIDEALVRVVNSGEITIDSKTLYFICGSLYLAGEVLERIND